MSLYSRGLLSAACLLSSVEASAQQTTASPAESQTQTQTQPQAPNATATVSPTSTQGNAVASPKQDVVKVEGTKWTGHDIANGGNLTYRFLPGGLLEYTNAGRTFRNGTWQQNGADVTWEANNNYAEYSGVVTGNKMAGKARNRVNRNWTWELTLEGSIPSGEIVGSSNQPRAVSGPATAVNATPVTGPSRSGLGVAAQPSAAQPNPSSPAHSGSNFNRHRLQLSYFGGWALDQHRVGELAYSSNYGTSGIATVDASFGGGSGGLITYGFAVFEFLELTVSGGLQHSGINMSDHVDELASNPPKGAFTRSAILIGPQVNIPLYHNPNNANGGDSKVRLTLEGGANIHGSPTLEANMSAIPGGTDMVLNYATGVGWHGAVGIELVGTDRRSDGKPGLGVGFGFRLGYYAVNYALKSATENGATVATSTVSPEFRNVSGDAINATLSLAMFL